MSLLKNLFYKLFNSKSNPKFLFRVWVIGTWDLQYFTYTRGQLVGSKVNERWSTFKY